MTHIVHSHSHDGPQYEGSDNKLSRKSSSTKSFKLNNSGKVDKAENTFNDSNIQPHSANEGDPLLRGGSIR